MTKPIVKPCPFCGSGDILTTVRRPSVTYCLTCDAQGPKQPRPTLAITAWNRRPADPRPESQP